SSPRFRAKETAEILSRKLNVPIEIIQNLRERNNYGVLTGLTKEEAKQKFPEEFAKISKDKCRHNVKNSESYEDFKERVKKAFDEITSKNDTVAVITHGGIISTFFREVLKREFARLGDCAIIELEYDGKYKLVSLDGAELE
ncbi:histidine phosphatase family protein, partial [Candidatus Woesearchaeota archaeon]|nr:histidine phosphatase family protein [Candidatus Woesearchaeota archaeon]